MIVSHLTSNSITIDPLYPPGPIIWSSPIPMNSIVFGVTCRVITTITGSGLTGFSIGDGSDVDRWGANIALAAGTITGIANFTILPTIATYGAATNVVLTPVGGANFETGAIKLVVHFLQIIAPSA